MVYEIIRFSLDPEREYLTSTTKHTRKMLAVRNGEGENWTKKSPYKINDYYVVKIVREVSDAEATAIILAGE